MVDLNPKLTVADEDALLSALEEGKLQAVLVARRRLNLSLKAATECVDRLQATFLTHPREPYVESEVLAVGPFSGEIAESLDYSGDLFAGTRKGARVIASVFLSWSPSSEARLAAAFGTELHSAAGQRLDACNADTQLLTELFDAEGVEDFVALRDAGFRFYFMRDREGGKL